MNPGLATFRLKVSVSQVADKKSSRPQVQQSSTITLHLKHVGYGEMLKFYATLRSNYRRLPYCVTLLSYFVGLLIQIMGNPCSREGPGVGKASEALEK